MKNRMKNRVLVLLVSLMALTLLAGCGGKKAEMVDSGTVVLEDDTQEEETQEEVEPEQVEEPVVEPEPEPEPVEWIEDHGLTISPQGEYQVTYASVDVGTEPYTFVSDFDATMTVTITETTEGVEEGFKKVTALIVTDLSNITPGLAMIYSASAFDRYTGISFDYNEDGDATLLETAAGESVTEESYITIQYGDESYAVSMEQTDDNQYPLVYFTRSVICPVDYEGTVFYVAYLSLEAVELNEQIDCSELHTLDELPVFGEKWILYFTMSNE